MASGDKLWRIGDSHVGDVPYRRCSVSVLDTIDDPTMQFDDEGRSQYYHQYRSAYEQFVREGAEGRAALERTVDRVKAEGAGKRYDCIIGLSGGVDSTFLAMQAVRLGLRPLAVHFDNGWNSSIAVSNVENAVTTLGLDLHTLVVDWAEFRDLQLSYLRASVVDVEVPTDHAIAGTLYRLAATHGVRHLLTGSNVATESVLPPHWIFNKLDHVNLLDIHKHFGTRKLKSYPIFGGMQKRRANELLKIESHALLNLVDYNFENAKSLIASELGWREYGAKHHESVFTRFYQCYILPRKFGIDKRKAHLSNLIFSGQLNRGAALKMLESRPCDENVVSSDRKFLLKKLEISSSEFERIMLEPPRPHTSFKTERPLLETVPGGAALRPLVSLARQGLTRLSKPKQ